MNYYYAYPLKKRGISQEGAKLTYLKVYSEYGAYLGTVNATGLQETPEPAEIKDAVDEFIYEEHLTPLPIIPIID